MNSSLTLVLTTLTLSLLAFNTNTMASSAKPKVRKFFGTEGNTTCIVMEAGVIIRIPYTKKDNTVAIANITLSDADTSSGTCHKTDTSQSIAIHFGSIQNSLSFEFERDGPTSVGGGRDHPGYRLHTVSIVFVGGGSLFPDASPYFIAFHSAYSQSSDFPRVGSSQGYYMCNTTAGFDLSFTAVVELYSWRFKAFVTDNSVDFLGSPSVCGSSDGHNAMVIVGSVIVGVVVIAAIAVGVVCVIRRRRFRGSYSEIN